MDTIWVNETGASIDANSFNTWRQNFANGGTIAQLESTLAYSPGPASLINYVWQQELGLAVDAGSLATWQNSFANGGNYVQLRIDLAYSAGVSNVIETRWQQDLGVGVDSGSQTYWIEAFAAGYGIADLLTAIAYSPGGVSAVNALYENELGRAIDSGALQSYQTSVSNGGLTLQGEGAALAHSAEAAGAVAIVWSNVLGTAVDSNWQATQQNFLASGGTLSEITSGLANSSEAAGAVATVWSDILGTTVDPSWQAAQQSFLATGGTLSEITVGLATSTEAANAIQLVYSEVLGETAAPSQVAGSVSALEAGATLQSLGTTPPVDENDHRTAQVAGDGYALPPSSGGISPGGTNNQTDSNFIVKQEGGIATQGYVPNNKGVVIGQSGVTIGGGVDLGQQSASQLAQIGVNQSIIMEVTPYLALHGSQALNFLNANPLTITASDASSLTFAVMNDDANKIANAFNNSQSSIIFANLPTNTKTAIIDLGFNYQGKLYNYHVWQQITAADWSGAVQNLNNFGDLSTDSRRVADANLIQSDIQSGALNLDQVTTSTGTIVTPQAGGLY